MQWIETSGKDVQEAIESALFQLGIARDELEYTVVSEPRKGILGLGKAEARIRARVKPARFKPKEEGRRTRAKGERKTEKAAESAPGAKKEAAKRSGTGKKEGAGGRRGTTQGQQAKTKAVSQAGREGQKAQSKKGGRRAPEGAAAAPEEPASAAAEGDGKREPAGKSKRTKSGQAKIQKTERTEELSVMATNGAESDTREPEASLEVQADLAREFLAGLLEGFGVEGEVMVEEPTTDSVTVCVNGEELGLLIGQKAATLTAIQDLTRIAVQRSAGPSSGRLFVDVGGYRAKRRTALEGFARKTAEEVLESGASKTLEPMPAADRKVIHDALNGFLGVSTRSEGEEPHRRVVIAPEG